MLAPTGAARWLRGSRLTTARWVKAETAWYDSAIARFAVTDSTIDVSASQTDTDAVTPRRTAAYTRDEVGEGPDGDGARVVM